MSDNQVLDQSINEVSNDTVPEIPVEMSNSLYISDNEQHDIDLVSKILNDISENIKEEYTKSKVLSKSNDNIEAADISSLSDSDDNMEEDKLEEEEEEEDKLEKEEEEEEEIRYIHAIILKERNNDLPFPIVFMGTLLMFLYGLKLFISICNVR